MYCRCNSYQSALIPKNLPCPEKFQVAPLYLCNYCSKVYCCCAPIYMSKVALAVPIDNKYSPFSNNKSYPDL